MNKKDIMIICWIIGFVIMVIVIAIISAMLQTLPINEHRHYNIDMNQTKLNDGYELSVTSIGGPPHEPSILGWQLNNLVRNEDDYIVWSADFPTNSGQESIENYKNITISIIWLDNDNDKKLSVNDNIKIYSPSEDLQGYTFRLIHRDKEIDLIGQIEFQ